MTVNPKELPGSLKPPLDFLENIADVQIAEVLAAGAAKYGRRNFLRSEMRMTTYGAAIRRHIGAWLAGEDFDPETGLSHIAHIGANVHVVLAALEQGTMTDDRCVPEEDEAPDGDPYCCGICESCPIASADTCGDPECAVEGPCDCKPAGCDVPENGEDDEPVKFDLRDLPRFRDAILTQAACKQIMQEVLHGPEREAFWADLGRPTDHGDAHDFRLPLKFRAGDRVRVVPSNPDLPASTPSVGREGVVINPFVQRDPGVEEFSVEANITGAPMKYWRESELELVEANPIGSTHREAMARRAEARS